MAFCCVNKCFLNRTFRQYYLIFRYVRNVSKRREDYKVLKGSVKAVTDFEYEDYSSIQTYDNFVKNVKSSSGANELEIEEALSREEDFGTALENITSVDTESRVEENKSFIKKKIIARKYSEMETNLLTCAAKEQIRYLHQLNPHEWTPEALSESFPITVTGIKKLLKSNFVLKSPDRIKAHDDEVAKRWKILESGEPSEFISFYTQCLWKKGKIMKQNYKGNPNLPTAVPDENKVIQDERPKKPGEFAAIVQQYINYKKEKELSKTLNSSSELQVAEHPVNSLNKSTQNQFNLFNKKKYYIDDERENRIRTKLSKKSKFINEDDVLHSQFQKNLMEDTCSQKSVKDSIYHTWLQKQSQAKMPVTEASKNPVDAKKVFIKVQKYNKESVEKKDQLHSKYKEIKSKIKLPTNSPKKNALYKVNQCVYDENGEFLYRLPA